MGLAGQTPAAAPALLSLASSGLGAPSSCEMGSRAELPARPNLLQISKTHLRLHSSRSRWSLNRLVPKQTLQGGCPRSRALRGVTEGVDSWVCGPWFKSRQKV